MVKKLFSAVLSVCLCVLLLPNNLGFAADPTPPISGALKINALVVDESGAPVPSMNFAVYKVGSNDGSETPEGDAFGGRVLDLETSSEGVLQVDALEVKESVDYWLDTTTSIYALLKSVDSTRVVKKVEVSNKNGDISADGDVPMYLGLREKMTTPRIQYFKQFSFSSTNFTYLDESANSATTAEPESVDTQIKITVEPRTGGVYKDSLNEYLARCKNITESDYASGYSEFDAVRAASQSVADNSSATQSQVDEALSNLKAAINGLIKFGITTDIEFKCAVIDENGKLFSGAQKFIAYKLDDSGNATDEVVLDDISPTGGYISLQLDDFYPNPILIKLKENDKYTSTDEYKVLVSTGNYTWQQAIKSVNGETVDYGSYPKLACKLTLKPGWVDPSAGVKKGDPVSLADIPVEYDDSTPVEDGFTLDLDIADDATGALKHSVVEVKDSKLKGIVTPSEYEAKVSIQYTNQNYNKFKIVDSLNGALSFFGRYQNQLPLKWNAETGNEGTEVTLDKIVIKKNPTHDDSTNANGGMSTGAGVDTRYNGGTRPSDLNTTYNTMKVNLLSMPIKDGNGDPVIDHTFKFTFFDATLQEFQQTVSSVNSALPTVEIFKDHHYIVYLEDAEYSMSNAYFTLNSSNVDEYPIDDKTDRQITQFTVTKRAQAITNPDNDKRKTATLNLGYLTNARAVDYTADFSDCELVFTSQFDTVTARPGDTNEISVDLIEDITYMVTVNSNVYTIDSFPLAMKNHDEIPYTPVLPYNHLICGSVSELHLIDKANAGQNNSPITSISGKSSINGINFMTSTSNGQYLLNERILGDVAVPTLTGENYEVIDLDLLNMYRQGEISKLATGNFTITTQVKGDQNVKAVYAIAPDGTMVQLNATQSGDTISFNANRVSIDNFAVVYGESVTPDVPVVDPGFSGSDDPTNVTEDISAITANGINKNLAKTGDVFGMLAYVLGFIVVAGIGGVVYSRRRRNE